MKILIPSKVLKPHHVKHIAAGATISGTGMEIFLPYHIGTIMLGLAACLAIYEPMIFHHIEVEIQDAD